MTQEIPIGQLKEDQVLVAGSLANSLYNRGYYGQPVSNGLLLSGFEALHLLELERLDLFKSEKHLTEEEIIQYFKKKVSNFMVRYLVYKDLRNRGYVVNQGQGSSFFFRLYERGAVPKKDGAKFYVVPLQEGNSINLTELDELITLAEASQKILIFGMVDASGDVSYLKTTKLIPPFIGKNKDFTDFSDWSWSKAWDDYLDWDK